MMAYLKNWRLIVCVAVSLLMMKFFGPLLEEIFLGSQNTSIIFEALKGAFAALIGYGFYLLFFRPKPSN